MNPAFSYTFLSGLKNKLIQSGIEISVFNYINHNPNVTIEEIIDNKLNIKHILIFLKRIEKQKRINIYGLEYKIIYNIYKRLNINKLIDVIELDKYTYLELLSNQYLTFESLLKITKKINPLDKFESFKLEKHSAINLEIIINNPNIKWDIHSYISYNPNFNYHDVLYLLNNNVIIHYGVWYIILTRITIDQYEKYFKYIVRNDQSLYLYYILSAFSYNDSVTAEFVKDHPYIQWDLSYIGLTIDVNQYNKLLDETFKVQKSLWMNPTLDIKYIKLTKLIMKFDISMIDFLYHYAISNVNYYSSEQYKMKLVNIFIDKCYEEMIKKYKFIIINIYKRNKKNYIDAEHIDENI